MEGRGGPEGDRQEHDRVEHARDDVARHDGDGTASASHTDVHGEVSELREEERDRRGERQRSARRECGDRGAGGDNDQGSDLSDALVDDIAQRKWSAGEYPSQLGV